VRTDMKRVVIARETVDQSLFGQRLVFDDPVRSAVAWNGQMLRRGCNAVGEGLSRDLCSQVERCGLVGGRRNGRYVDHTNGKVEEWDVHAQRDEHKGYRGDLREGIRPR
jgi:hypothetical protein